MKRLARWARFVVRLVVVYAIIGVIGSVVMALGVACYANPELASGGIAGFVGGIAIGWVLERARRVRNRPSKRQVKQAVLDFMSEDHWDDRTTRRAA